MADKAKCKGNTKNSTGCMDCPKCAEEIGTVFLKKYKKIVDAGISENKAHLLDRVMKDETKNDWIEYGYGVEQFVEEGLSLPGTLIRVQTAGDFVTSTDNVRQLLIGNVNTSLGDYESFIGLSDDTLVLEYRVISIEE